LPQGATGIISLNDEELQRLAALADAGEIAFPLNLGFLLS